MSDVEAGAAPAGVELVLGVAAKLAEMLKDLDTAQEFLFDNYRQKRLALATEFGRFQLLVEQVVSQARAPRPADAAHPVAAPPPTRSETPPPATESEPLPPLDLNPPAPPSDVVKPETSDAPQNDAAGVAVAGSDPKQQEVAQKLEAVNKLRAAYPVFKHLIDARQAARTVPEEFQGAKGNQALTSALVTLKRRCVDMAVEFVNLPDPTEGLDLLKGTAQSLLNQLKELDNWAAKNTTHECWPKIKPVRQYLWDFIKDVWGGEYIEFKPPDKEKILTWFQSQKWPRAMGDYVETEKIAPPGRAYQKEEVIKVLRPGILRKKPDNVQEIIQKALVQICRD